MPLCYVSYSSNFCRVPAHTWGRKNYCVSQHIPHKFRFFRARRYSYLSIIDFSECLQSLLRLKRIVIYLLLFLVCWPCFLSWPQWRLATYSDGRPALQITFYFSNNLY